MPPLSTCRLRALGLGASDDSASTAAGAPVTPALGLDVEEYRLLVEHAPTLVWRAGLDGKCNYHNARWIAFTGERPEPECREAWTRGVHPEDMNACLAMYLDHFERQQAFEMEYRFRRFDGVYRHVLARAVPYQDSRGQFAGFIGSAVDVEDRPTRAFCNSANEFFEMSLDNVCVAGLDGYFKQVNPSWTRTLGWTAEELMSKPSVEFVHPEDRGSTLAARERLRGGASLGPLTNRYLCKDGSYRWFEWRSVAHVDRRLVYGVARDITERKSADELLLAAKEREAKLERQLIFAERMASVGTLAAGVAHEINNPLAYVSANIALILDELRGLGVGQGSEPVLQLHVMASEAQEGAERIRKIVRGLKTFSRAEEERRARIDVRPLLELSVDMVSNEIRQRARLVKEYGEIPHVEADEARLGQVFINLLINAAQALPEGGSANEIRIVTSTDAMGRAVVEVRDTGAGIPKSLIGRVFDPFFTTKAVGEGTGLGLSICHNIVASIGGEITVVSEESVGTTFRMVLPAASMAVDAAVSSASLPKHTRVGVEVLVVDDEPAIGGVLSRVLRDHKVTVVTMAKQALELLDAGRHFDIILSDLMMPEMSGMDFFEELARRFPALAPRVVFVSGGAFTPDAKAFLNRVANAHIEKPFNPQQVRDIVERAVSEGSRLGAL